MPFFRPVHNVICRGEKRKIIINKMVLKFGQSLLFFFCIFLLDLITKHNRLCALGTDSEAVSPVSSFLSRTGMLITSQVWIRLPMNRASI